MAYYPNCEDTLVAYNCDPCTVDELARISNVAFVKKTYYDTLTIDPKDGNRWKTGINNDFDIILIPDVSGELPEPSEILLPGYGRTLERLVSYDFAPVFNDRRYKENCDFYNLIKQPNLYHFAYFTETQGHISQVTATIIPKPVIPNDIGAPVEFRVLVKWRYKDFPCPFNTPEGLFDNCWVP